MVNKGDGRKKKCRCIKKIHKGTVRCPHARIKADKVSREDLARNQYLELLCSLKGTPHLDPGNVKPEGQDADTADDEEEGQIQTKPPKRTVCHGQRPARPKRWYVHNFLAEVWALLTPEMITRLKEMLQNEFGMSSEEADTFINEQKKKTILPSLPEKDEKSSVRGFVVRRGRKCAGIRHYYHDQFSKIVSAKLTDYLVASLSSRRTQNQRKISECLLKNICDVTGEKFTLQYPKTLAHKIMVFLTDRVSGWLAERVAEAEELIREDRAIEKSAKKKKKKEANSQKSAQQNEPLVEQ